MLATKRALPGYCGAQNTFYVAALKGGGRIYQQAFIDTVTAAFVFKLRLMRPIRP